MGGTRYLAQISKHGHSSTQIFSTSLRRLEEPGRKSSALGKSVIKFNPPAIVAEGLAQACLNSDWIGLRRLLPEAEEAAGGVGQKGEKSLFQLLDEIQEDERLSYSRKRIMNKVQGAMTPRPHKAMLKYITQFKVAEDQMDEKLAEMMNAVVYYTAAAQGPRKFDFVCIHAVNSSIFFSTLLARPSLSPRAKLRLLE
ncbi:hypothetical protein AnigIFM56816_000820 [Aspergillus niger]|nr:hypothetical protein AnigIFM56816_000820 [Aspergillus niger]